MTGHSSAPPPELSRVVSLVLPLYNEADGVLEMVSGLVDALHREDVPYELVLVNNGSTDTTGAILDSLARNNSAIRVVTVGVNQGYGWGIICGLKEAHGDIVGFMCADGQVAPPDVVRVYRALLQPNVDLAKVVRLSRGDGLKRRIMSGVYNRLFRTLFSVTSRDVNGTPKLMWRSRFAALDLTSRDWFIDAELMIKAAERGLRVLEVPVDFHARDHGASNVRLSTSLEFIRNMVRYRFASRPQVDTVANSVR